MQAKLEPSWLTQLESEFKEDYMKDLKAFLAEELKAGRGFYPAPQNIFKALNTTPFDKVKVVILGQDPYHGPGQAMGLSFSVPTGVRLPPSLRNIFKELKDDVGTEWTDNGDLTPWAEQGVLLLNSVLTVSPQKAGSHAGKGWEKFTDACIAALSRELEGLIFVLWGNYAKQKGLDGLIDVTKHQAITSPHPSPFSAHNGFFGSKPFSKVNQLLVAQNKEPIDWQLATD